MNASRAKTGVLASGVLIGLSACAVGGGGVAYDGYSDVGVGYVGGFYEPYGNDYGGWGGRYHVGPPRGSHGGGDEHPGGGRPGAGRPVGGHSGGGGRAAPSIPSHPRGH
jgi:hypothetical protein